MYDLLCQEIHLFLTPEEVRLFEALKRGEKIDRNQKYRIKKKIMDYIKRYW
jgi:competence protein ComX